MANAAKTLVNCSVSNCNYWGEHNICRAEEIIIEIDKHSGSRMKEEFAEEMTFANHHDVAPNSSATCCLTFKPKA
ncbi:hypothetical protein J2Z22_002060 [Paenibacillus forsythiae]|uniref:DUF1540 domain-containing protein n=1 Tax=Paenibacillus forsythiae TaxID=365616 RepID=A0ABU3H6S8_9BACL|nr:DUF1540 domain-containing protein [Paenibacillus forsythiae]MDT3426534.1 hypothetical protein [Paenibacillus forsythiae]